MTRTDLCPLFVEWVENWAPDYLPSGPDDASCAEGFNVTQRERCALAEAHSGPCRAATPREMETRATSAER